MQDLSLNILDITDNSIKAMAELIEINITVFDNILTIEIKDNGKGSPENELSKIFTAGYTTKGVGVGTGLGLAICNKIIEKHKGEILVNSELGHGSEFIITIQSE